MSTLRFDPAHAPLFDISWDDDKKSRMSPQVVTTLLREQVPVLDFVKWEATSIDPGAAESVLPLNPQSTNQHFTHQAALFVLAADYTGGTALASLATGWPVVGVHPVISPQSASLWLLKFEIKYLRPSVTDMTVSACIDEGRRQRIQKRFLDGKAVIESITMTFRNGNVVVAEATAMYFMRQTDKLRSEGISADRVNTLYELKLTSSAELIAGVRARESGALFLDPYAEQMAGQHGMAIATRFCERSPQLGGMVAARTKHLDETLEKFTRAGGRQIVNVGVGWDMRAFRLDLPAAVTFYELDFPTTLAERRQRLSDQGIADKPGITRIEIPVDVRTMPLADVLATHLDPNAPVLIAWEGMSMYFSDEEVVAILDGMRPLLKNPDSLLWVDLMDREPIQHPDRFPPAVREFMRGMQILGEPFTFGVGDAESFLESAGFRCLETVTSDAYFPDSDDAVYSIYQFCVAGLAPHHAAVAPRTFLPTSLELAPAGWAAARVPVV